MFQAADLADERKRELQTQEAPRQIRTLPDLYFFKTLESCYELQLPGSRGHPSLLKFMFGVHAQVSFSFQPANVWRESNVEILGYTSDLF